MSLRSYFVTPVIKSLFGLLKQEKKSPNPTLGDQTLQIER